MNNLIAESFLCAARDGDVETIRTHVDYFKQNGISIDQPKNKHGCSALCVAAITCKKDIEPIKLLV